MGITLTANLQSIAQAKVAGIKNRITLSNAFLLSHLSFSVVFYYYYSNVLVIEYMIILSNEFGQRL